MLGKYFVYVDDDQDVYKIPMTAESEEAAREYCSDTGEVIAVKDVTEEYQIDSGKVRRALFDAGFSDCEVTWMVRTLMDYSVIA